VPRVRAKLPDLSVVNVNVNAPRSLVLFLARSGFLLDGENFFARVMSAVRADVMRQAHLVAIRTRRQVYGFHREMTAAAVAASFRYFSFW
jgi:hypothetical protein